MTKPEALGMSRARLARLDEVMKRRYVDGGHLPGILTQVYRKGELVHTGMAGHMDLERDKPMREDAIFRIYSMTKPITAVALMMLVEEGAARPGRRRSHTHIPVVEEPRRLRQRHADAAGRRAAAASSPRRPERPMKVVDLVTHTSGLTYGFMMRTSVDAAYRKLKVNDFQTPGGLDGMIEQLSQLPLEFSPGTPGTIRSRST